VVASTADAGTTDVNLDDTINVVLNWREELKQRVPVR
jgi:hypothetical protein